MDEVSTDWAQRRLLVLDPVERAESTLARREDREERSSLGLDSVVQRPPRLLRQTSLPPLATRPIMPAVSLSVSLDERGGAGSGGRWDSFARCGRWKTVAAVFIGKAGGALGWSMVGSGVEIHRLVDSIALPQVTVDADGAIN